MTTKTHDLIIRNIREHFKQYLINHKIQSCVLGISGGIDSALIAVLSYPICKELNIPLIGRSIPIESNKLDEIERAIKIGKNFCDDFKETDLTALYHNTRILFEDIEKKLYSKIALGNIKARIRMQYLYSLAGMNNGIVLSTDNYTEYLLGFWTLHGDVGDIGMIQNLWKTEVYELSKYLLCELNSSQQEAVKLCIEATPTDGLGITNSDLDQLGASSYEEVDNILKYYIYDGNSICVEEHNKMKNHPVIQRYLNSNFKRNNPYNFDRRLLFKSL
jgi:NAD+ synthetase